VRKPYSCLRLLKPALLQQPSCFRNFHRQASLEEQLPAAGFFNSGINVACVMAYLAVNPEEGARSRRNYIGSTEIHIQPDEASAKSLSEVQTALRFGASELR
jgi:hypothetical protein